MNVNDSNNEGRGISSKVCELNTDRLDKFEGLNAKVYLSKPDWTIFDQQDAYSPIGFTLDSAKLNLYAKKKKNRPFNGRVQYLTFETINDLDEHLKMHELNGIDEDFWITPSLCPSLNDVKPVISLPKQLKITFDQTKSSNRLKATSVSRTEFVLDYRRGLIRFQNLTDTNLVKIQLKNKLLFELPEDGTCIHHHDQSLDESGELIDLLKYLSLQKRTSFFLVGAKRIRGIMTNVYRKLEENKENTKITTLYLKETENESSDQLTHDPVRVHFETYRMSNSRYELDESVLYNFYEFRSINDDELVDEFDLSQCVEETMVTDFSLGAKREKQQEIDARLMKDQLRKLLVKISGQIILNFPNVQIDVHPEEIIASIKFLDFNHPFVNFDRIKRQSELPKKDEAEKSIDVESEIECAISALKSKESRGFQYCDINEQKFCDIITDSNLPVSKHDEINCSVERKRPDVDVEYETFNEKFHKFKKAIDERKLNLNHLGGMISFDRLHRIKEESDIDRSQLYERKAEGQKLISTFVKAKLEDGIFNLNSCYEACTNVSNSFSCDSFSFCKKTELLYDCHLANIIQDGQTVDAVLEKDANCDVYDVSMLPKFREHSNKQFVDKEVELLPTRYETKGNECAALCLQTNRENSDNTKCLSIEVCEDENDSKTTCRLSTNQTLWDNEKLLKDNVNCNAYSVKHILNFYPTSLATLKDFVSEEVVSLDQCATSCDMADGCDTFNYCETESSKTCRYSSKDKKGSADSKLPTDQLGCVTYTHRKQLIGAPLIQTKTKTEIITKGNGNGFRIGSLFGFIFLFLFIGLLVGSAAFYGYKFYLNKGEAGEGVAVNFSNLRDDV